MRSTQITASLTASLYSCRTRRGFLSSSSANISLYCLKYATAKAERTKDNKSQVWLLYLDRWRGRTPTKSVYRIQNFKGKREYRLEVLPRTLGPTRTAKTFLLAAMLFCSHAVETTVETGSDLSQRHRIRKYPDSTVHTYPRKFRNQNFPLWRADSNVSGFADQIHRLCVDGRRIRKEKYTDSKVSGYVWTGP